MSFHSLSRRGAYMVQIGLFLSQVPLSRRLRRGPTAEIRYRLSSLPRHFSGGASLLSHRTATAQARVKVPASSHATLPKSASYAATAPPPPQSTGGSCTRYAAELRSPLSLAPRHLSRKIEHKKNNSPRRPSQLGSRKIKHITNEHQNILTFRHLSLYSPSTCSRTHANPSAIVCTRSTDPISSFSTRSPSPLPRES
jgi:hypothetical protein